MGLQTTIFRVLVTSLFIGAAVTETFHDGIDVIDDNNILKAIQEQLASLQGTNQVLLAKVAQLEETTHRLENENTELKQRIHVLEDKTESIDSTTSAEQTINNNEVGDNVKNSKSGEEGSPTYSAVRGNNTNEKTRNRYARQNTIIDSETPMVAFYATLTSDIHGLGKGQNIVFDKAHTNLGSAYHAFHGIFTAPYKGLYMFSATVANIITGHGHVVDTLFVVNGNVVARTHGHSYDMSSHTLLLVLNQGDDFSIQSDGQMMESYVLGSHYSSMAGRLVSIIQ